MLKDKAEKYYNSLYAMPPCPIDLAEFAEQILNEFIQELESNQMAVAWNYGCDSVIFINKNLDDKKSLESIKEKYLGKRDDQGNTIISDGTRASGHTEGDKEDKVLHEESSNS